MSDQEYKTFRSMVDEIIDAGLDGLSLWEREFIESVDDWLDTWGVLSNKQKDILRQIYAEKVG